MCFLVSFSHIAGPISRGLAQGGQAHWTLVFVCGAGTRVMKGGLFETTCRRSHEVCAMPCATLLHFAGRRCTLCMGQGAWLFRCLWCRLLTGISAVSLSSILFVRRCILSVHLLSHGTRS